MQIDVEFNLKNRFQRGMIAIMKFYLQKYDDNEINKLLDDVISQHKLVTSTYDSNCEYNIIFFYCGKMSIYNGNLLEICDLYNTLKKIIERNKKNFH